MAAVPAYETAISNNGVASQSITTGSFTPTANTVLVVVAKVMANGHSTVPSWSVSDSVGLTWTEEGESFLVGAGDYQGTMVVYSSSSVGVSPTSMTVTADPFSTTDTGYASMSVYSVAGGNQNFPVEELVFDDTSGEPLTLALSEAPVTGTGQIWQWWGDTGTGDSPTWDTGPTGLTTRWTNNNAPQPVKSLSSTTNTAVSKGLGYTSTSTNFTYGVVLTLRNAPWSTTYSTVISGLSADHHWKFDGNSVDAIGAVVRTDTSVLFTAAEIARDANNCMHMNGRLDRISLANTTTISNSAQARKAVCGWFMVDGTELPHCRIYGEGTAAANFQFLLMAGNSVVLETRDSTHQVQVYSDIALAADRAYHLTGIFEGNGYANEVRFYIDGVEQTAALPTSRAPGQATLAARTVAEFGDPAGTVGLGGFSFTINSAGDNAAANQIISPYYNHWAAWGDTVDAVLTANEVREGLFEAGALADISIATGTQSAMQTALDAYASTLRADAACCIEINAVTGGGDFTLNLDNITFDPLASIHVRYNGTADTLTLVNQNGADCSITSAPFGGLVQVFTDVTVQVTVKDASDLTNIVGARVLLEEDPGGTDILSGVTNGSGVLSATYQYSADQAVTGRVRKGTTSTYYKTASMSGTVTKNGLDLVVLMVRDE